MKYEIKYSVEKCRIKEKRKAHDDALIEMQKLASEMSHLVIDWNVGTYARKLDRYEYLLQLLVNLPSDKQAKVKKEIAILEKEFIAARSNYNIIKYRAARNQYDALKSTLYEYQQSINVELRKELEDKELPGIYIYQMKDKEPYLKHIIVPNKQLTMDRKNFERDGYIIYPQYDLVSNREYRHFYNKTSFQYLEALTDDYSYQIENKKIGPIKVKKM